ncbi:ATP-binding protein, partial [Stella sp.]|uniref:hybrid sensor histidine kinase/response regulator n=1 Tax=Stella sp. TaxID=2912054 RepID=UPI0035B33720
MHPRVGHAGIGSRSGPADPRVESWNLPIAQVAAAAWIIASLALGALVATLQLRDRHATLETFADLRTYSANAAADAIARIMRTMDILFTHALDDWRKDDASLGTLYRSLVDLEQHVGHDTLALDGIAIVSPDGRIAHHSDPAARGIDVRDREYFTVHRDLGRESMWIGEPIATRMPSRSILLPVSWAIRGADGDFRGVLLASLSPEVLSRVLFNYRDTEDSFVALASAAGATMATDRRGRSLDVPGSIISSIATEERSPIVVATSIDGVGGTWHVAARGVADTGMRVVLGATEEQMLADWHVRTVTIAALILFVILFLGAFGIAIVRLAREEHVTRRRAEAAAHRATLADLSKTEFLAVMSHEIRTPLTAIIGMSELMSASDLPPAERQQLHAIRTGGRQMLAVVNDVLDFTRLGAGGVELERIPFSLPGLVEEVRSTMGPVARDRGLSFDLDIRQAPGPWLRGDPNRLRQILLNLVGNAAKFTERGGVTLTVAPCPDGERPGDLRTDGSRTMVRFAIADTGIGIPRDRMDRLFQPFSQADSSMARRYGGSGLGLAICKRLVDAMGGRITVESRVGAGSRFVADIPLAIADAPAPEPPAEPAAAGNGLSLLVAEDVAINRELVRAVLTAKGHRVTLVADGAAAVAAVAAERFDAVLMDIQMPVMDGI